jgi:hypothetical protein
MRRKLLDLEELLAELEEPVRMMNHHKKPGTEEDPLERKIEEEAGEVPD